MSSFQIPTVVWYSHDQCNISKLEKMEVVGGSVYLNLAKVTAIAKNYLSPAQLRLGKAHDKPFVYNAKHLPFLLPFPILEILLPPSSHKIIFTKI
jgi:hypothetical protein